MKAKQWFRYFMRSWYFNHPLGKGGMLTNKKGMCEYCYRCGNIANGVVKRYWFFTIPICRKHYEEEYVK